MQKSDATKTSVPVISRPSVIKIIIMLVLKKSQQLNTVDLFYLNNPFLESLYRNSYHNVRMGVRHEPLQKTWKGKCLLLKGIATGKY